MEKVDSIDLTIVRREIRLNQEGNPDNTKSHSKAQLG